MLNKVMTSSKKIALEGITYDDVLLLPAASSVLPRSDAPDPPHPIKHPAVERGDGYCH